MMNRRSALLTISSLALAQSGRIIPTIAQASTSAKYASVIDAAYSMNDESNMADLKTNGVNTIFRYYSHRQQPELGLPDKILSAKEAKILLKNGFSLGTIFQYYNASLASMSQTRAELDAGHALSYAGTYIKQPEGSAIYFGVDGPWKTAKQIDKVKNYFETIKSAFAEEDLRYKVGVYGSGLMCKELLDAGLVDYTWLALSRGWPDSREFYNSGRWSLYQFSHHYRLSSGTVDANLTNPKHPDIGVFRYDAEQDKNVLSSPETEATSRKLLARMRFTNKRSVNLHKSANENSQFETLGLAPMPIALQTVGNFTAVDITGNGHVDGYIKTDDLNSPQNMPRY